jgi:hypothetical protein
MRAERSWLLWLALLSACGAPEAIDERAGEPAAVRVAEREPVARLVGVVGDVRLRRAGEVGWADAPPGSPLFAGDALQTMEGGRAVVSHANGPESELGPRTMVVLPESSGPERPLSQLAGVLVARLGPEAERLEVELPPGVLSIERADSGDRSSTVEARVEVDESHTEIEVRRGGRGRLARTHGEPLDIVADRFARVTADGELLSHGWARGAIALIAPEPHAVVRTRSEVTLRWSTLDGVTDTEARIESEEGVVRLERGERGLATVRLDAGRYRWSVVGRLDGEEMRSDEPHEFVVEIDREPPPLVVLDPSEGVAITTAELRVRGHTEPGARVEIDGALAPVDDEGHFSLARPIPRGLSNVVVRAWDGLGNGRVVTRSVVRR